MSSHQISYKAQQRIDLRICRDQAVQIRITLKKGPLSNIQESKTTPETCHLTAKLQQPRLDCIKETILQKEVAEESADKESVRKCYLVTTQSCLDSKIWYSQIILNPIQADNNRVKTGTSTRFKLYQMKSRARQRSRKPLLSKYTRTFLNNIEAIYLKIEGIPFKTFHLGHASLRRFLTFDMKQLGKSYLVVNSNHKESI